MWFIESSSVPTDSLCESSWMDILDQKTATSPNKLVNNKK